MKIIKLQAERETLLAVATEEEIESWILSQMIDGDWYGIRRNELFCSAYGIWEEELIPYFKRDCNRCGMACDKFNLRSEQILASYDRFKRTGIV